MYGFFEIVSRYGLGTLLTRDVAADKNQSSRYLTNVLGLRTILWLASLPVLALVTGGFRVFGGDARTYLIMQNETSTIGLFQDMFDRNILTFNPGWDRAANPLPTFEDARDLQRTLKDRGLTFSTEADESTTGPTSFILVDPDGNPILIDQHVPRPSGTRN